MDANATTTTSTDTTTSTTTNGTGMANSTGMASGSGMSGMDNSMMMSSTPMLVTGTVQRYYVDRNGYVSAMDIQTANGTNMVRFAPGMGQRIFSTYPVGGQASVWAMGSPYMGMTRMDVVGMGNTMPTTMMQPYMTNDTDLLQSEPYITAGAKLVTLEGTLRRFVTDSNGEVLGIVLSHPHIASMMNRSMGKGMMGTSTGMSGGGNMSGGSTGSGGSMSSGGMNSGAMSGGGMMSGDMGSDVLVRIPREERQVDPGAAGTSRRAGLFKGSDVEVTGYPEAPAYGVMSVYPQRIAATAIVVNGRAVGPIGFPHMMRMGRDTLLGFDLGGTGKSGTGMTRTPEEMTAMRSGYRTYDPSMMSSDTSMNGGSMNGGSMNGGTGSTGGGTGSTGGATGGGTSTGTGASTGGGTQ